MYLPSTINKNINNIVEKPLKCSIIVCTSTVLSNINKHRMYINVIFQTESFLHYSVSLIASYYLCIWVNGCSIYYQSSTCNKLPQSAQMLHFLPMVTLCLYPFLFPKSPKSFIYNGHPSPVCWKEIPKNYNMTSRSSCSWILSAFPVDTASFVLLYTSGHSVRCRFVHFSIFFALFCWIIWVTLLVDFSLAAHKQPYFDRMGSCKLLSSLPTEFTPAHVSFTAHV